MLKPRKILAILGVIGLLGVALIGALFVLRPEDEKPVVPNYRMSADKGIKALQPWYSPQAGMWDNIGWWNAANALETTIDYMRLTKTSTYADIVRQTYDLNNSGKFLNDFYDDEGWWALAWLKAYDQSHEPRYLDAAKTIFADMKGGWDETCGGGLWWKKNRRYKNAIPNELFLTLAARLHSRTPGDSQYKEWALREWAWFKGSGMINSQNLINDGLTETCANNAQTTWTYNQGVILGGLAELAAISGDQSYVRQAESIADAAIAALVDQDGVLVELCEKDSDCGADGPQFKGIFVRNVAALYTVSPKPAYKTFIARNAASIWRNRDTQNRFGLHWNAPIDRADPSRQSSALDCFNAALTIFFAQ